MFLIACSLMSGMSVSFASSTFPPDRDPNGLRDHPFQGSATTYLDGEWRLYPSDDPSKELSAKVPGDLLTDLQRAGEIPDPLFEMNFLENSIWEDHQWNYATTFRATDDRVQNVLVFDGVKMGATIRVNGHFVGNTTDQFLRYYFPLDSNILHTDASGENNLTVTFDSTIQCDGRWMACTGGWDWAPYTQTSQEGAATFTRGIWKSVYVTTVETGAISHLVVHTFYKGAYPVTPLIDGQHAGFDVHVRVHMYAPSETSGTLTVTGSWMSSEDTATTTQSVDLPAGESSINVTLAASSDQIKLWWIHGMGEQHLYDVVASFTPASSSSSTKSVETARRIGFRHFAIVTGDDSDPTYVRNATGADGTSSMGMLFRVNGAAVFSRGANMIPMEELEGRMRGDAHQRLVQSAVDANFNTFRVWGGGIYYPDAFYDACDALGVMLYHDMMFAQQGHSPKRTKTQEQEFRHQVRRLSHHPSIVVWDGCNECVVSNNGDTAIYENFVLATVADEDKSRSVWPACPAAGWASGVDRLTSRPNGKTFQTQYVAKLETHGPYQHGNGWIAANSADFDPTRNGIPTILSKTTTGVRYANIFGSEFGSVVMSSFESMSAYLKPEHWALHGGAPDERCTAPGPCDGKNAMAERNYDCDPLIRRYFGEDAASAASLNTTGETNFKRQLYQCMLSQALEIKSDVEHRRSTNTFGVIVWQYNEIWPTGGWGSIEYGTPEKNQVLGGRWKPLQYIYERHLFRDVICACSDVLCFVKNDGTIPFAGSANLSVVNMYTGATRVLHAESLQMRAGAGISHWFDIDTTNVNTSSEVVTATVYHVDGTIMSQNIVTLALPKDLHLPKANITAVVESSEPSIDGDGSFLIRVSSDVPALYVTLTTLAHGRFSEQAFLLNTETSIRFIPFVDGQLDALKASLRVEDLSGNMYKLY